MVETRPYDWVGARKRFVESHQRLTYKEIGAEFGIGDGSVGRTASDESWLVLRAEYQEHRLREGDAAGVLVEAIRVDRTLTKRVSDLSLLLFQKTQHEVDRLTDDKQPQANLNAINTASFAVINVAKALKEMGVIGLPKSLADAGKEQNGQWNPKLLQQINVTVQGVIAKGQQAEAAVKADAKAPRRKPKASVASDAAAESSSAPDASQSDPMQADPMQTPGSVEADEID